MSRGYIFRRLACPATPADGTASFCGDLADKWLTLHGTFNSGTLDVEISADGTNYIDGPSLTGFAAATCVEVPPAVAYIRLEASATGMDVIATLRGWRVGGDDPL